MSTITAARVYDVRFPTSLRHDGSDAMNRDADYSAAYLVLETDAPGQADYGFTFTIGRGNDLVTTAVRPAGGKAAVAPVGGDVARAPGRGRHRL